MKLFDEALPFFKGNLHTHTTRSDGKMSPEDVMALYRAHGYDFLALTDHWHVGQAGIFEGLLLLAGIELDVMMETQAVHVVGLGVGAQLLESVKRGDDAQTMIDGIRGCGGRAILCHPAWSLNTPQAMCALSGITATEIYNSFSGIPWNADRADSSVQVDMALTHGMKTRLVASDDAHFYTGEACKSFIRLQARELTQEAILAGLDAGKFYASQGPDFVQLSVEDGALTVTCSPVEHITFYSNLVWSHNRCRSGHDQTTATYPLRLDKGETWVRVELIDRFGRRAWSSPIYLSAI
ncbi:MAG: CehA/McbA family metallohydrolase [Clostridia bacterium]